MASAPTAPQQPATLGPTPSAPPTPTASPQKPPAAAPGSGTPTQDGSNDDPFSSLDAKVMDRKKAAVKPPEEGQIDPNKQPADKQDRMISGPKELRMQLEKTTKELRAKSESVASMEARIKEFEARGKDTTVLAEQLAAKEKALEEAHARERALKFEASDDFKKQWDKPFMSAQRHAIETIKQLQITDPETGQVRFGTFEDLNFLYNLPYNKAIEQAETWFGAKAASIVLRRIDGLQEMDFKRREALDQEKANAVEREKAEQAQQATDREALQSMWVTANKGVSEAHAEWFQPDPNDPEGNELLSEGFKIADTFFYNRAALSKQQRVILDANMRHRAAAFSREVHRNAKLTEERDALKAQIAEMKGSEPGTTNRTTGEKKTGNEVPWEQEMREAGSS